MNMTINMSIVETGTKQQLRVITVCVGATMPTCLSDHCKCDIATTVAVLTSLHEARLIFRKLTYHLPRLALLAKKNQIQKHKQEVPDMSFGASGVAKRVRHTTKRVHLRNALTSKFRAGNTRTSVISTHHHIATNTLTTTPDAKN